MIIIVYYLAINGKDVVLKVVKSDWLVPYFFELSEFYRFTWLVRDVNIN